MSHISNTFFRHSLQLKYDKNILLLILFGTVLTFLVNLLLANLITLFVDKSVFDVPFLEEYSFATELTLVLLIAPLVETFLFQYLIIITVLVFNFKYKNQVAIIFSALAFASIHYYNYYYVGIMFFVGLLLAFFFVRGREKFSAGFLVTFCIHAGMNALSYIEF